MKRGLTCSLVVVALLLVPASQVRALEWLQEVKLFSLVTADPPLFFVDIWVTGKVTVTKVIAWDKNGMLTIR